MKRIPVADAHCDLLYYMYNSEYSFELPISDQAVSLNGMKTGWGALQLFAAWIDVDDRVPALQQCMNLIDTYRHNLLNCDDLVEFDKGFDPSDGKIGALLTIEGGEAIEGKTENLRLFYDLGVRAMTLTWNHSNELASAAMSRRDRGITPLGRKIIKEMERLNMAIDVAHLSDNGIDDVLKYSEGPVFSSHTNARSMFFHKRSICDQYIKEISARGGVIGINYYSPQLIKSGRASISDVADHIKYVADIGGIESVALGSDFDGMGPQSYPMNLSKWGDVPKLLDKLTEYGFSESDIKLIAYENLARFLKSFV